MNRNLIKKLKDKKILTYGDFTLRSGERTNFYCDIKEALGNSDLLKMIVDGLLKKVPENATCIAGSGYGGITLASLVAYKKKLPLVLVRDKVKAYGTKKAIDGHVPTSKDVVCIVDDVFTTGSSIKDTKDKLVVTKAKFTKSVVVLNRSNSKSISSLIQVEEII